MMFIMGGLYLQMFLMGRLYRSSGKIRVYFDNLIQVDDMNDIEEGTQYLPVRGEETKFFNLVSDDDDDEKVTFDQSTKYKDNFNV